MRGAGRDPVEVLPVEEHQEARRARKEADAALTEAIETVWVGSGKRYGAKGSLLNKLIGEPCFVFGLVR